MRSDTTTIEPVAERMRNGSVILTDRLCEKRVAKRIKVTTANVPASTSASSLPGSRPFSLSSPTGPRASNAQNGSAFIVPSSRSRMPTFMPNVKPSLLCRFWLPLRPALVNVGQKFLRFGSNIDSAADHATEKIVATPINIVPDIVEPLMQAASAPTQYGHTNIIGVRTGAGFLHSKYLIPKRSLGAAEQDENENQ